MTKIGCLIIHGFGGNVGEIEPLRIHLEESDFQVVCPELKGHTNQRKDLWKVNYEDWIVSAHVGLEQLYKQCDKVIVIGFSMGGLIAANLVKNYPNIAMITLCTPIYHWDIKRVVLNLFYDIKARELTNFKRYVKASGIPLRALLNFKCLLLKTKPLFKELSCPVFIAQSMLDDTVQHRSAEFIYDNIQSKIKEKKYYSNSGHLICQGPDREELFVDIEKFIRKST